MGAERIPAPGRMVDGIHALVEGSGLPVVVLEAGIAASSLSWSLVQLRVAEFATVVSYDRAGFGWSEERSGDGTALLAADELAQLLDGLSLPGPYLLVGHSFGGLIVRLFQQRHPKRVCGIVLVDPVVREEWRDANEQRLRMLARGAMLSKRGAWLARLGVIGLALRMLLSGSRRLPRLMARASAGSGSGVADRLVGEVRKMPPEHWPAIAMHWSQARSFRSMAANLEKLPLSAAQLDEDRTMGNLSLIVLSAKPTAEHRRDASLSSRGVNIEVENTGHWIQLDQPEIVVNAIREVFRAQSECPGPRTDPSP